MDKGWNVFKIEKLFSPDHFSVSWWFAVVVDDVDVVGFHSGHQQNRLSA